MELQYNATLWTLLPDRTLRHEEVDQAMAGLMEILKSKHSVEMAP